VTSNSLNGIAIEIERGMELERSGNLPQAEQLYQRALEVHPEWTDLWFRLGLVFLKQRKLQESMRCFRTTLGSDHRVAESWNYLGITHGWMGQEDEAEQAFKYAVQSFPRYADALLNHAISLRKKGRIEESQSQLERALEIEPKNVAILSNLSAAYWATGEQLKAVECLMRALQVEPRHLPSIHSLSSCFFELGRYQEAEQGFRTAIQIDSSFVDAHVGLGVLLASQFRFEEARQTLERAVALYPRSVTALANLANSQRELGMLDEAERNVLLALEIDPSQAKTLINLATLRLDQRQLASAEKYFRDSLSIEPYNGTGMAGLGAVLAEMGRFDESLEYSRRAITIDANLAQAHLNMALILLVRGDWADGFREFEWRLKTTKFQPRNFAQPYWAGQRLLQQTLLIHCEQGLGDTLQFCRYIALAKRRCHEVIFEVPRPLLSILSTCSGSDRMVAYGDPLPNFDYHVSLMSLPGIFESTVESVPCDVPYLGVQAARVDRWRLRVGTEPTLKIGIAWRGSPNYGRDRDRSIPLAMFESLASLPQVQLISLHRREASNEIQSVKGSLSVTDFGNDLDKTDGAFVDTAAVMRCLDLVISVDSAATHLAGALGVPVWLLSPYIPDWRWMLEREDSPWYPTVRIFRQPDQGNWSAVFDRVREELIRKVLFRD
jgi:tetratricopeptide (TPR) repeat protein